MENTYKKIILVVILLLLIISLMVFYFYKKTLTGSQNNRCTLDVSSLNILYGSYYAIEDFVNNVSDNCTLFF